MEKTARGLDSGEDKPGMAAVMGLDAAAVANVVSTLSREGVFAANFNSPVQTVLSGTGAGLAKAEAALKAAGAKRFIRLKVSGPFHSPLMAGAAAEFEEALKGFAFADPILPVYSNVTGERITSGEEARELCARQVVSPVQWVSVEKSCMADGFQRFFEAGPGTVLSGLFKALKQDVNIAPAGKREDIEKIAASGSN
jgi:[acyl-carrier-protein] S-malonyltransferase